MRKIGFSLFVLTFLSVNLVLAAHSLPTDFSDADTGLLEGMSNWAYNVTEGAFFALLLLGFCVVLFIATSTYSTDRALGFAGVTGLFGSMFLVSLRLISWWLASIFILVGAVLIVVMVISKSR